MDWLVDIDQNLLLSLNAFHNSFFDMVMWWVSQKWVWVPVYALVLWALVRKYGWQKGILIVLSVIPVIILADQGASGLLKPWVGRLRPCHEPALAGLVHLVDDKCGGQFGFVSSHAANFFGLAMFIGAFFSRRWRVFGFCVAIIVAYSRIYLGVHYPGDVLGGAILGLFSGLLMLKIFKYLIMPICVPIKS